MREEKYIPPYTLTDEILSLVVEIGELVGAASPLADNPINPKLRRDNRIKTIQASLAIETNSLSLDQVTAIINGRHVLGPPDEIREVTNAYEAYERLLAFDPFSAEDILAAHRILMNDLTKESGKFRTGGVGIFAGEKLVHMAPPAERVPHLMRELLDWTKNAEVHPLIKSCVFHYEFEFIHPFLDGNGRMGRMWQTLLLYGWKPIFAWLPVETMIKTRQDAYCAALGHADKHADSAPFIAFLLHVIRDMLTEISQTEQVGVQLTDQVKKLLTALGTEELPAKELMNRVGLRHRPTFRENYLLPALTLRLIEMTVPDKPNSSRQKYRKRRKRL
jgi:Fic family protein